MQSFFRNPKRENSSAYVTFALFAARRDNELTAMIRVVSLGMLVVPLFLAAQSSWRRSLVAKDGNDVSFSLRCDWLISRVPFPFRPKPTLASLENDTE